MLLLFLLLLSSWAVDAQPQCVYSQFYWLRQPLSAWPAPLQSQTMCGAPWYSVLQTELYQLPNASQRPWLLAFHLMCTAALNAQPASAYGNVTLEIATLTDSLERSCESASNWTLGTRAQSALDHLSAFSRGQLLPLYPPCGNEFANLTTTFSFANVSDLFLITLPNNETVPAGSPFFDEMIVHVYKIQTLLIVFTVLTALCIVPVLIMYVLFLKNKKRDYAARHPNAYQEVHPEMAVGFGEIDLSDEGEVVLDDLSINK